MEREHEEGQRRRDYWNSIIVSMERRRLTMFRILFMGATLFKGAELYQKRTA
jgi:hypothetical protein